MEALKEGKGELLGWHDPDEAREWVLKNKSRELKDKTMSVKEAVSRFVRDGDFIASGANKLSNLCGHTLATSASTDSRLQAIDIQVIT
jgi:hypothetical protein